MKSGPGSIVDTNVFQNRTNRTFDTILVAVQSLAGAVADFRSFIGRTDKRILYAVITVLSLFVGIFWIWITPTSYKAAAVLGTVEDNPSAHALGNGIGQVSQALGVNLSTSNLSQGFGPFQELLTSTYLVRLIDQKYHIADMLNLPRNNVSSGLIYDIKRAIKTMIGVPTLPPSRFEELLGVIHGDLEVTPNLQTQTLDVTFTAANPKLAERLLTIFINESDGVLKQRAALRAKMQVDYLTAQVSSVNGEILRQALYPSVVDDETKFLMASSNLPYSVQILDEPFAYSRPDWPRPLWQILVVMVIFQVFFFSVVGYRYLLPESSIFQKDASGTDKF